MKGLAGWGLTAGPHPTRWVMGLTGRRPSLGDEGADGCEGPSSVVTGGAGAVTWGQGGPAPLCSEEAQEVATEKEPQRVRRKRGARGVRREDDSERQPQAGVRRACGGVAESVRSAAAGACSCRGGEAGGENAEEAPSRCACRAVRWAFQPGRCLMPFAIIRGPRGGSLRSRQEGGAVEWPPLGGLAPWRLRARGQPGPPTSGKRSVVMAPTSPGCGDRLGRRGARSPRGSE